MMAGFAASYLCIQAFSETDLTEDLKRFDVPTLVLHVDDDQVVPFTGSAPLSSKLVNDPALKVYRAIGEKLILLKNPCFGDVVKK
jgi:non-heme chloroperoxidase